MASAAVVVLPGKLKWSHDRRESSEPGVLVLPLIVAFDGATGRTGWCTSSVDCVGPYVLGWAIPFSAQMSWNSSNVNFGWSLKTVETFSRESMNTSSHCNLLLQSYSVGSTSLWTPRNRHFSGYSPCNKFISSPIHMTSVTEGSRIVLR